MAGTVDYSCLQYHVRVISEKKVFQLICLSEMYYRKRSTWHGTKTGLQPVSRFNLVFVPFSSFGVNL